MKKTYSHPDILFESFSLCSSIAGSGCAHNITTQYSGTCAVMFGDKAVFTEQVGNICAVKVADGSAIFNGLCYHVPTDMNSVFNS